MVTEALLAGALIMWLRAEMHRRAMIRAATVAAERLLHLSNLLRRQCDGETLVVTRSGMAGTNQGNTWYISPGNFVPCRKFHRVILEVPLDDERMRKWFSETVSMRLAR